MSSALDKSFTFTVDDSILFLKDLCNKDYSNVLSHPLLCFFAEMHDKYDLKVQFNLFYREGDFTERDITDKEINENFNLSHMPDKYKTQWQALDWIKFSFHSNRNNLFPYNNGEYKEIYDDCKCVQDEIIRFAGENSLAKTTTIHYVCCHKQSLKALKDLGVIGLLGIYGTEEKNRISYGCNLTFAKKLQGGGLFLDDDGTLYFSGIDVILNEYERNQILDSLEKLKNRSLVRIMNHEMHFYAYDKNYQKDFCEKLESAVDFLTKNDFKSVFYEDQIKQILKL